MYYNRIVNRKIADTMEELHAYYEKTYAENVESGAINPEETTLDDWINSDPDTYEHSISIYADGSKICEVESDAEAKRYISLNYNHNSEYIVIETEDYKEISKCDFTPTLKDLRAANGFTQAKLANIVGLTVTGYSNLETGRTKLTDSKYALILRLADELGDSLYEIAKRELI